MRRPSSEPWLCRTMLQVAAYGGHTTVLKAQIAAGVAVDETDERGKTALMFAAVKGHVLVVRLLLNAGADVNHTNRFDSCTALLYATENGHTAVVDALLKAGAWTNVTNEDGEFPLSIACSEGMTAIVAKLIASGADVNEPARNRDADEVAGFTPLLYTTHLGSGGIPIMKTLLKAGANVDGVDAHGITALLQECEDGDMEIIDLLLAAGADMRHVSLFGTALHRVQETHCMDVATLVDVIIAEGVDIDAVDCYGRTALSYAMWRRNKVLAQKLLAAGANVNVGDKSPLAAAAGSTEMVVLLVAAGADVNHRDDSGETPLSVAARQGDVTTVRELLNAFADEEAVDNIGETRAE